MVQALAVGWIFSLCSLLQCLFIPVTANEPIDSICQSSSEYLDAMYNCRSGDFQVSTFCVSSTPYELACNRSKRIAVYRATLGPARNTQCNNPQTVASAGHAAGSADSECCLLPAVEARCKGKVKCVLSGSDLQQTVDARQCSAPPSTRRQQQRTLVITVVFICVSQGTLKNINRDKSNPDAFCEGQADPTLDGEMPLPATDNQLLHQPADIFKLNGQLATTSATQRLQSTHSGGLTSSDANGRNRSDIVPPVTHRRTGGFDWIWSFVFVKENMDRFLIYLFLSVAIGVICVLLVVILGLCFGHRLKHRKRSDDDSDVIHRKQSSTQTTTDVTSSLIASNHSPGVEMVRYVPTNSGLRYQPLARSSAAATSAATAAASATGTQSHAAPTAPGNMVHFAADGSSTGGLGSADSFRGNGGIRGVTQGLNLPLYEMSSTSRDSVDGDDDSVGMRMRGRESDGTDDYRSSTLGRFYTNPYRHDSYRSDGFRTLQHK